MTRQEPDVQKKIRLSLRINRYPPAAKEVILHDYSIRVHGIPIRWRTEITEWQPPHHFVDKQLRGPYTLWHHTHTFEELNGGTLCLGHVRYRPRGGALVHRLFVRRDVERIFTYRQYRLKQLFPQTPPLQA